MKKLVTIAGALPFFLTVFLNAFVDLGHKIVIQNTIFKLYDEQQQIILTAVLNSLILLPFILLFRPAGRTSDRYSRASVMRFSAWLAAILCFGVCASYYLGWFWSAFAFTFALATQSAFYSPAKMGYIKELFGKSRLGEANGILSALVIIAILSSTFVFSIFFESMYSQDLQNKQEVLQTIAPIGWLLIATACIELVMAYRLPKFPAVNDRPPKEGVLKSLHPLIRNKPIRLAAIGLSTFWGIGQVMLAAFPAFFKSQTGIENTIALQGVLACSGVGIAIGSFIAGKVSKDHIELGVLPIGALGIAIGLVCLPTMTTMTGAAVNFLFIGIAGGMFIVPLNALIQFQAKEAELGKTLSANNFLQNVTMFAFLVLTVCFAYFSLSSKVLLHIISFIAIIGCGYTIYQLPQSLLRFILQIVFRQRYRINVQGVKNIPSQGGALLLGNHVSWIDWAIIQIAVPRPIRFVMIKTIYQKWYLKWFFDLVGCIPIEQGPSSRQALNAVKEKLENGEIVCLFPEGTLSRTGHMVEFRKGFERICGSLEKDIPIIPFYLHGLWGSQWSRANRDFKQKTNESRQRQVIVALGQALPKSTRATELKQAVAELSIDSWQQFFESLPSLGEQWVRSAHRIGHSTLIHDSSGVRLSGKRALTASTALASRLRHSIDTQNIGIALPASAGSALANMAVLQLGKTVVNLNFTAGERAINSALDQASINTVISSKKLQRKLCNKGINLDTLFASVNLIYIEDLVQSVSLYSKITALFFSYCMPWFAAKYFQSTRVNADDAACILFSSGSEGSPKGVCLSHKNITANIKQTIGVLNPDNRDVILGNLPPFHAFGLTITQYLPLLEGLPVVFDPDPTDAVNAAKLITRHQATILFGTSTFLRFYAANKKIHPLMLASLRYVVSGAEKLNPEIKRRFEEKFKKEIFEGYGTTETTPVAAVNLRNQIGTEDFKVQVGQKPQSVGLPLPGSSVRIVDPGNLQTVQVGEQGMVLIGGVQVMLGYLNNPDKTAEAIVCIDNQRWYITGDKGYIDEDGFLYIVDRYSRFAKVGGEMVSLSAIEKAVIAIQAESTDAEINALEIHALNLKDDKKGEKIILLTTHPLVGINKENFQRQGLSNLALPSTTLNVETLPKLASGKMDFTAAKRLAEERLKEN